MKHFLAHSCATFEKSFWIFTNKSHPSPNIPTSKNPSLLVQASSWQLPHIALRCFFIASRTWIHVHGPSSDTPKKIHGTDTLQGINISHLGKRKIIFKYAKNQGDMLVPWYIISLLTYRWKKTTNCKQTHHTWNLWMEYYQNW